MAQETAGRAAAVVAPIDDGDDLEIHPRRRLLSTNNGGPASAAAAAAPPAGGPSWIDCLYHFTGNTKLVIALLISIVLFSYLTQELEALSVSASLLFLLKPLHPVNT
jgi:hypothetical protein